ncbi:hypothetical protein EJ05DRAFT_478282 [Pseudovirgaria hyperparasitica]|uniref:Sacsin/Nov domain-containing protein n=1 Tax=Pseudovirgaria hyperparasitica TaxID=470096 RepID=A0A6A6W2C1_9PEZI|nr:uncharacterized protein EJ05DRAFT_478282 [Pseudovirgaria hyperparasitica]KAF2756269.1 hypothetical protein EJ05DRAFT_478282 [Pseudovirgaria hyperparasitica]
MASTLDYERLRQQTMTTGEDAAVTVNTRALIDKVLARYSSEFTTLRELVQNAADAGAKKVTITFETSPSLDIPAPQTTDRHLRLQHTIKHHAISNVVVTNDGQPFSASDWARLKSIAEGNPDETKIGAFGVGFYSVFADCDEPFVISGSNTMAFYWKGNTLYTRSGRLPQGHDSSLTSFSLPYRNVSTSNTSMGSSPVPDLLSLCQFLSTSLTFVGLEQIDLNIDDWSISTFRKTTSPASDLPMPADFKPTTDGGIMTLRNVSSNTAQIDATWSNIIGWVREPKKQSVFRPREDHGSSGGGWKSFLSKLTIGGEPSKPPPKKSSQSIDAPPDETKESGSGSSSATVFIRVHTLHVLTKVTTSFSKELERATKKPPPKSTRVSVLTSPFDESSASLISHNGRTSSLASKLFSSVLPTNSGRIFIGFPTGQTTGPLCHISMPSIIPTVERESIDLNAKYISSWNGELLQVAGIGCRLAFLAEMRGLQSRTERMLSNSDVLADVVAKSIPEAIHIYKQFTFQETTPSSRVGAIIEQGFWTCTHQTKRTTSMVLLSTQGILPSPKVRITAEKLSFLNNFPVVPDEIVSAAPGFMESLVSNGFLSQMTVDDIKQELEARALSETELLEFLKWCGAKVAEQRFTTAEIQTLFRSAIADVPNQSKILQLSLIQTFLNPAKIAPDLPLPPSNAPFTATSSIPMPQLKSFGWVELQILPWLAFVVQQSATNRELPEDINMLRSAAFAARVLLTVSKAWEQLNQESKLKVAELLGPHTVVPTTQGMKKPEEAYLPSVKGFSNLAILTTQGLKSRFLSEIGVRSTVELSVAFKGLEGTFTTRGRASAPEGWDHEQILKYFASVLDEIPKSDIERLKTIPFCLAEKDRGNYLWKVSELYAPSEGIQRIRLPTIRLRSHRPDTAEGKLLKQLGLVPYPTVQTLITCLRRTAQAKEANYQDYIGIMKYFTSNFHNNRYDKVDMSQYSQTLFLMSKQRAFPALFAPASLFSNDQAEILGVKTIHEDLKPHANMFGVEAHPPSMICVQSLISQPPKTLKEASQMFSYMASRVSEKDKELLEMISDAQIVPIFISIAEDGSKSSVTSHEQFTRVSSSAQVVLSAMRTPSSVFIGKDQEYKDLLTYVDFGEQANMFLLKAGSRHEPSSIELLGIVAEDPGKFLRSIGVDKYLELLRKFADNCTNIKYEQGLFEKLKRTPFLLALEDKMPEGEKELALIDLEDDEEPYKMNWSLELATDTVVNDDVRQYDLFRHHIKLVPQEDLLEKFYIFLGAKNLSSIVTSRIRQGVQVRNQDKAHHLHNEIISRSRIFLYEHEKEGSKNIKHSSKWLKSNLKLVLVEHITIDHSLKGSNITKKEKKTANYTSKDKTLSITEHFDMHDIGREIVPILIQRPKQMDIMAFERIMTESLKRLQKKGYNVDRILRQREIEATVQESQRQKQFEEEKARQNEITNTAMTPSDPRTSIDKTVRMPGAFSPDSPQRPTDAETSSNSPEQDSNDPLDSLRKAGTNFFTRFRTGFRDSSTPNSSGPISEPTPDTPRSPAQAQRSSQTQVADAIRRSRPHGSSTVNSAPNVRSIDVAPDSYCDANAAHNLTHMPGDTAGAHGIRCFAAREFNGDLLEKVRGSRGQFGVLLTCLAGIFGLSKEHMHIFYDAGSSTIAFNLGGALFFNAWWFWALHGEGQAEGKRATITEVWDYWYIVACHELAHNLVKEHSSAHEYLLQEISLRFRGAFYGAVFGNTGRAGEERMIEGGASATANTSVEGPKDVGDPFSGEIWARR